MKISKKENPALIKIKKQKIKIILNVPKNNECYECSHSNPEFISLNNGIFLCKNCVKHHSNYPKTISNILKNDLNNLTLKNIQYLYFGGNERLKQFIQVDYPNLKKCSFQNLYKTYAMDYYRKNLEYLIEGGIKPIKPNKNKACELIKINKFNTIKKKNNVNINNSEFKNNIEETNSENTKRNQNSKRKNNQLKYTKSSGKHRPNINLILSNFNNSLNNINTINIYNYNDKIITETYYKKRFLSQIFKNINIDDVNDSNNLTDINNITFNKEENNKKNLKSKSKKIGENKLNTNIKITKRKEFLDKQYINLEKDNTYEKPLFQNYINTCHKGNYNKKFQYNSELSSTDLKYLSNDISDMKINTRNNFSNKNIYISQKIFKKKTVGNSFSIHNKKHPISTTNNSLKKIPKLQEEKFNKRNSNKNELISESDINNSLEENDIIKVNRQINVNKKRKRYSLNDIILENKYNIDNLKETEKEKKHRVYLNNEQKSKIIERIRRVASSKKEKNINSSEKKSKIEIENKTQNEKVFVNRYKIKKNQKNQIKNKNNTSLLIKDMINQPSNIRRNILEIIKSNNLSHMFISPHEKKINSFFTDTKSVAKKVFEKKMIIKELYQRKTDDI